MKAYRIVIYEYFEIKEIGPICLNEKIAERELEKIEIEHVRDLKKIGLSDANIGYKLEKMEFEIQEIDINEEVI